MGRRVSRRTLLGAGLGAAVAPGALGKALAADARSSLGRLPVQPNSRLLLYDKPARVWTEALPVGNGRLGAMHFGGIEEEHVQLNEGTLWAGGPHDYDHPGALDALPEIRRLIFEGKYREATELADKSVMSQPLGQAPYLTVGDLHLNFDPSPSDAYSRGLDLEEAVSFVHLGAGNPAGSREVFASYPDQVIVIRLRAAQGESLSFRMRLSSPHSAVASFVDNVCKLEGTGSSFGDTPGQVRFAALAHVDCPGAHLAVINGELVVSGGSSATILVSMATSYRNYQDVSGDALSIAQRHLDAAVRRGYESLRKRHVEDHQRLFNRVSLNLGGTASKSPTTEALIRDFADDDDPVLPALYFDYGRYLMISASRPGGQPATLQGLWNDSVSPPWGSKYTININTEMNYWPVETTGLAECHEPLFEMISEIAKTGRKTAQVHYGAKGWVTHHNTDGWRGTAPIDGASWGLWPMGSGWLSTHLWQHYLFGGDVSKLGRHYELMKGAAEFYLSTLVEHPTRHWLVTNPSTSPENNHGHGSGLCAGATMDLQIIRDLFSHCIDASQVLDRDEGFRQELTAARARLAPMQIGHAGQLQEWLDDWDMDAPEIHHRHVSHLYGLFPSAQITPEGTPELAQAARRSLEIRGDEGTGWSLAWKINLWARLGDGNHAYKLIRDALRLEGHGGGGVYPNLFDAHPPFQIDGNFGFVSGVTEMLLQRHDGTIHVLPALPDAWPTGSVKGLRARGGAEVDIIWSQGALREVTLHAARALTTKVRNAGKTVDLELSAGQKVRLGSNLERV